MIRTLGLSYLALAVRDLERSLRFTSKRSVHQCGTAQAEVNTPDCNDIITFEQADRAGVGQTGGIAALRLSSRGSRRHRCGGHRGE